MDTDLSLEQQLRAQIDRLRDEFPDTQDLYREVCVLLFFRHGVTPTANRLYQLVRKGSMTAPAEALSKFWEDLRQKSRLRIEHPELPDDLKEAAGALTAAIWAKAVAAARDDHKSYREEFQAQLAEARASVEAAAVAQGQLQGELATARARTQSMAATLEMVQGDLAAATSATAAVAAQLEESRQQNTSLQAALDRARGDFSVELEKQRSAVELAEQRCRAVEQRSLLEIDRERTKTVKLLSEIEKAKSTAIESEARHRLELATVQRELGDARQIAGELKGRQQELSRTIEATRAELDRCRIDFVRSHEKEIATEAKASTYQIRISELERSIEETLVLRLRIAELESSLEAANNARKKRAAVKTVAQPGII